MTKEEANIFRKRMLVIKEESFEDAEMEKTFVDNIPMEKTPGDELSNKPFFLSIENFREHLQRKRELTPYVVNDIIKIVSRFIRFGIAADPPAETNLLSLQNLTLVQSFVATLNDRLQRNKIQMDHFKHVLRGLRNAVRHLIPLVKNKMNLHKVYNFLEQFFSTQHGNYNQYHPYKLTGKKQKSRCSSTHSVAEMVNFTDTKLIVLRKKDASLIEGYTEYIDYLMTISKQRTGNATEGCYAGAVRDFFKTQIRHRGELSEMHFDMIADPARIAEYIRQTEIRCSTYKGGTMTNKYEVLKRAVRFVRVNMAKLGEVKSSSKNPDYCELLLNQAAMPHRPKKNLEAKRRATVEYAEKQRFFLSFEQFRYLKRTVEDSITKFKIKIENSVKRKSVFLVQEFQSYLLTYMFMSIPTQRLRVISCLTTDAIGPDFRELRLSLEKTSSLCEDGRQFVGRVINLPPFTRYLLQWWCENGRFLLCTTPGSHLWFTSKGHPLANATVSEHVSKVTSKIIFKEYRLDVQVGPQALRKLLVTHTLNQMFKHARLNKLGHEEIIKYISELATSLGNTADTVMRDYYLKDIETMSSRSKSISTVTSKLLWEDSLDVHSLQDKMHYGIDVGLYNNLGISDSTKAEIKAMYEDESLFHASTTGQELKVNDGTSLESEASLSFDQPSIDHLEDKELTLAELAERYGGLIVKKPIGECIVASVSGQKEESRLWTCVVDEKGDRTMMPPSEDCVTSSSSKMRDDHFKDEEALSQSSKASRRRELECVLISSPRKKTVRSLSPLIISSDEEFELREAQVGDVRIANLTQDDVLEAVNVVRRPYEWLCTTVFDIFVQILQHQFPSIGLDLDLGGRYKIKRSSQPRRCYVIHTGASHWISFCYSPGKLMIFHSGVDANGTTSASRVRAKIHDVLKDQGPHQVLQMPMQQQEGGSDCGLFAAAACVDFAFCLDPSQSHWDQSRMREHMARCMSVGKFTPFPKHSQMQPVRRGPPQAIRLN